MSFDFTLPLDTTAAFSRDLPVEFFAISPPDSIQIDSVYYNYNLTTMHLDVRHTDNTDFVWIVAAARSPLDTLFCKLFVVNYTTSESGGPWKVSGVANPVIPIKRQRCLAVVVALYNHPIERGSGSLFPGSKHPINTGPQHPLAAFVTTDAAAWRFHIDHVRNGLYWSSAVGIDGDLSWIWTDHYDGDGSGDADSIVVDDGDVSGIRFWAFAGANERPTSRVGVARLTGIYPHPAHGMTTVVLETDEPAKLAVDVVDVLGRNARALADGFYYPGRHELTLNAASLPSGVYFVRMRTKGSVETRSFVVAR